jgi:hypothetical protein
VDRDAYAIIAQKQREALGETNAFSIESAADELRERLLLGLAAARNKDFMYRSPR